ncbi:unnamed protein product, partial [Rotaria sp. Silwood2]
IIFSYNIFILFYFKADSILITVEEEKASILESFYQQNPFADFSQMDEIQQRTQLDEQIIRHYFDSVRNHQWPNQSSYYCSNSHEIYSVESNPNIICSNSTNSLPIIVDSRISISPQSILSLEQMSIIHNQRDERLSKDESSLIIKENNNLSNKSSMILLNYPRLYSSSSDTSLDNCRQESIDYHRSSPCQQQISTTNPLYTDLTPVINSTPLPSFETLNTEKCSNNKMEETNNVICRSNSNETNGRINDCHSSTNSSDEIPLDNYQQFQTTWNHQENIYEKDS